MFCIALTVKLEKYKLRLGVYLFLREKGAKKVVWVEKLKLLECGDVFKERIQKMSYYISIGMSGCTKTVQKIFEEIVLTYMWRDGVE